jgi:RHS repeat-associated protein
VRYVDALVLRWRDADGSGDGTLEETLYATHDANFNVTALVGPDGTVVERYAYDPYGQVIVLNGAADPDGQEWTPDPGNASDVSSEVLYAGYRFDPETGFYHVRHRSYHPTLGRWTSRDPAGYVDGMNLYAYCQGEPADYSDPWGIAATDANKDQSLWDKIYDDAVRPIGLKVEVHREERTFAMARARPYEHIATSCGVWRLSEPQVERALVEDYHRRAVARREGAPPEPEVYVPSTLSLRVSSCAVNVSYWTEGPYEAEIQVLWHRLSPRRDHEIVAVEFEWWRNETWRISYSPAIRGYLRGEAGRPGEVGALSSEERAAANQMWRGGAHEAPGDAAALYRIELGGMAGVATGVERGTIWRGRKRVVCILDKTARQVLACLSFGWARTPLSWKPASLPYTQIFGNRSPVDFGYPTVAYLLPRLPATLEKQFIAHAGGVFASYTWLDTGAWTEQRIEAGLSRTGDS